MIETKGTAAQEESIWSTPFSRRQVCQGLVALGGVIMFGGGVVVAETKFPEDEELLDFLELEPRLVQALAQFSQADTAVHQGGNTREKFQQIINLPLRLRPKFVEADVWERNNKLKLSHAYPLGPFALNDDFPYFHLFKPEFTLEELAASAAQPRQLLMVDLKGIYGAALDKVLEIMEEHNLMEGSILSSSTDLGALDVLREKIDVVGVNSKRALRAVLQKRDQLKPGARVSLKYDLATRENTAELIRAEMPFWPYDIPNPQATLKVLEMGAQGVITNNLAVIAAMSQSRNPDPVASGTVRSANRWAGQA